VVVSRAAGLAPPIDSVYPQLDDDARLREETSHAHVLGFFGKSAIHPRQLPILHVLPPSKEDLSWARKVLAAFDAAGGAAPRLPDGEFVDKPWRSGRSACSTLPSAQRRRRRAGRRPSSISLKRPRKGFA
jgi:citrate lyase subunit beta / citryl-CoA lyase